MTKRELEQEVERLRALLRQALESACRLEEPDREERCSHCLNAAPIGALRLDSTAPLSTWARRTHPGNPHCYPPTMLTDAEADEIRQGLEAGMRGPVLIKWVRQLLDDRDERVGEAQKAEKARPIRTRPDPPSR